MVAEIKASLTMDENKVRASLVVAEIRQHPFIDAGIIVILFALAAFVFAVNRFGWDWTGFTSAIGPTLKPNEQYRPAKTLWDVLQLLFVPIILAIGGFWLNQIQKKREERTTQQRAEDERKAAERRAQAEHAVAEDNQREAALQEYIDKMAELLLNEIHLSELEQGSEEVRKIVRARTLTILPRLDRDRKRSVLQFLYESGLISRGKNTVKLDGADFRKANLFGANLSGANLSGANLSGANLVGADLKRADLSNAVLIETDLKGARLSDADLSRARLIGAKINRAILARAKLTEAILIAAKFNGLYIAIHDDDISAPGKESLSRADLCKELSKSSLNQFFTKAALDQVSFRGTYASAQFSETDSNAVDLSRADLIGVDLSEADLSGADLSGVDLSEADLSGALVITEQLGTAKLLKGATMPNGSKRS